MFFYEQMTFNQKCILQPPYSIIYYIVCFVGGIKLIYDVRETLQTPSVTPGENYIIAKKKNNKITIREI